MAQRGDFLDQGIGGKELSALGTIRQWESGAGTNPTALKRIGGTLMEVGGRYVSDT